MTVCSPSRLSLITGLRPDTIRVWDLSTHFSTVPDAVTLPQLFRGNGYHTRSIGKILHGGGQPAKDDLSWSTHPLYDVNRDPQLRYATEQNLKGRVLKRSATEIGDVPDETYIDGLICKEAEAALTHYSKGTTPFFCSWLQETCTSHSALPRSIGIFISGTQYHCLFIRSIMGAPELANQKLEGVRRVHGHTQRRSFESTEGSGVEAWILRMC